MSNVKLYNGDCIHHMNKLYEEDVCVNHIVCDLPYFGVVKDEFDNQWLTLNDYIEWIDLVINTFDRILSCGGNVILFCSRQNMWRICWVLDQHGFEENRTIIWARKRGFNNTRGKALSSGYEPILFWSKGKSDTFNQIKIKSDIDRPEYKNGILKDGVALSDVWCDIPALPHNAKEKVGHPTQKPLMLMERIISVFTNEYDTILDFCMGSGSTGVACANLNRDFIGIEKDEKYFNIAKQRINEANNKLF